MNELKQDHEIKIKASARPSESRMIAGLADMINGDVFVEGDGISTQFSNPDAVGVIPTALDQKAAQVTRRPSPAVNRQQPIPAPKPTFADVNAALAEDEGLPVTIHNDGSVTEVAPAAPAVRTLPDRIFTTGRLRAGKDFVLNKLGYKIHGFADPIYALAELFFGTSDKTKPGVREFMQTVGQWGRGMVNENYRLTPLRGMFNIMIRSMAAGNQLPDLGVDWKAFGHDNLWIDALLTRLAQGDQATRNAVSNVRFENEHANLLEAGWTHFHVMCSQATWEKRLKTAGMDPKSPALRDTSEQMAISMDKDTLGHLKLKPKGGKLRVIWNDEFVRCPSPRLYTLAEIA